MKWATNVARKQLLSLGICVGKFTHGGKFHLVITALGTMAPYAKVGVVSARKHGVCIFVRCVVYTIISGGIPTTV